MIVSAIAAVSDNNVIGWQGKLPWKLSADMKHFKLVTAGSPVIMGRKTLDSIGKPLKNRINIVLTRDKTFKTEGVIPFHQMGDIINWGCNMDFAEMFIIGGADIYRISMPYVTRLHITRVHATVQGDVYFPPINWDEWKEVSCQRFEADESNEHPFSICVYELHEE